jgi:hypothetical protein
MLFDGALFDQMVSTGYELQAILFNNWKKTLISLLLIPLLCFCCFYLIQLV